MNLGSTRRNYALDFVKVIATTAILFHHYQQIAGVKYANHPNFYFNVHFTWAWMVELFFLISGFFAFSKVMDEKTSFAIYLGRKLKRLLPVMACSTIVYCFLDYMHVRAFHKPWFFTELPNLWGLVVSCLGLQTGLGLNGYRLNNPMWFVSVLIQCYCLYYVLSRLAQKKQWRLEWTMLIFLFIVLFMRATSKQMPFMSFEALRGYQSFLWGGLVSIFVSRYQVNRPVKIICISTIAVYLFFTFCAPAYIEAENSFIFLFCTALLILLQTDTAKQIFCHQIWQKLSQISFNVYVWHSTLQVLLALVAPQIVFSEKVEHMYLYALISWVVGTLSHFLLERPLDQYMPIVWQKIFVRRD